MGSILGGWGSEDTPSPCYLSWGAHDHGAWFWGTLAPPLHSVHPRRGSRTPSPWHLNLAPPLRANGQALSKVLGPGGAYGTPSTWYAVLGVLGEPLPLIA